MEWEFTAATGRLTEPTPASPIIDRSMCCLKTNRGSGAWPLPRSGLLKRLSEEEACGNLHAALRIPGAGDESEERGATDFVKGFVGVLHHMELVVDDAAVGGPLLDAQPVGFPHVHAGRRDPHPLAGARLLQEELIQGRP